MEFIIKNIRINKDTRWGRTNEIKKDRNKIYVFIQKETVLEDIRNRRNRPYKEYKKYLLPKLMEKIKVDNPKIFNSIKDKNWKWNQYCGCNTCPCSPGFYGDSSNENVFDIFIDIEITK